MTPTGQYGASIGRVSSQSNSPAVTRARMIAELGEPAVAKMDHIRGIAVAAHGALMHAADTREELRGQRIRAQLSLNELGDLQRARMRHPEETAARESALQLAIRRYDQAQARHDTLAATYDQALALSGACVRLIKNRIGGFLVGQMISDMEWE